MALNIQGNIKIDGGITLPSCYARTFYKVSVNSNEVKTACDFYASKEAYENNEGTINAHIPLKVRYAYNRETDGVDILLFTQNVIKEDLENQGFSVEITEL